MCPQCHNSEVTLLTQSGDEFHCLACGYRFMKNGDQVEVEEEDDTPKPKSKTMGGGSRRVRR
jgi:Zn ribbon nucleic-acid-binding protein